MSADAPPQGARPPGGRRREAPLRGEPASSAGVFAGPTPAAAAHPLDAGALAAYLRARVDGLAGPLDVVQLTGGQSNPTYKVTTPAGVSYVLRRKPPGKLLPSAHAVDREYRVMSALAATDVPVPRTFCLCEDETVIGTPFYVMEYVAGRVFWDPRLPGATPAERSALFDELNRAIAALHRVDPAAVGLADYGRPGNYFARQIDRWTRQYRASETEAIPAMDRLIEWLPANIPPDERSAIVHGDYRIDNVVFHPTEPRILAVLDWELSTLGHPLADFSYHMMAWRLGAQEFRGMRGSDLAALGIPSEADYLQRYLDRAGMPAPPDARDWSFYMAYNMFRLAAILQGVMARALAGNAASGEAQDAGRRARPVAEAGWREVERER